MLLRPSAGRHLHPDDEPSGGRDACNGEMMEAGGALVWMKEMTGATPEAHGAGVVWYDSAIFVARGAGS